ncbi:hypothetical protein [Raineya orbicola]|uniref:Uncharacterized protein n=1 Tax=Raineya orbicola TaxID=2016530 RepID=A0A2N3IK06_9BACT|nr:hypothetical protein [Raineya orbicola]PKQ70644.1 hypothetical protein Rain11_0374 [Raineya orbicola]
MAFFVYRAMESNISLESYLEKKNIDWQKLAQAEPELWLKLQADFAELHPNSFEMQKKFLLNKIRRKYMLQIFNPKI